MFTFLTASVRNQLRFAFAIVIILSFMSTALAIWRLQALSNDTRELLDTAGEKTIYAQIGAAREQYIAVRDRLMALKAEGKNDEARRLDEQTFAPLRDAYLARVGDLLALQQKATGARTGEVLDSAHQSATALVSLCLATLILSIAAAHLFARALFRRLGGEPALAASVASEIAAGNLRVEVAVKEGDQASLMAALKRMRDSLGGIVGQVRQGTTAIGESIAEMSSEAQELSRRTESQAASLEETASSIEELTQGIQHSTDNAEQANELAAQASRVAQQGGAMVGQLVETMGAINESSSRIADIIGVIDGIAFQTNILALNAAVEAARAGEQGRGFAVVAGEVRALAQRSAAAAKEIKSLIDDSTGRVTEGTTLAGKAGETMKGIVTSIDRVSGIMNEIVASSREQASGIAQVNKAITQMDGATQQNAALVEESAAATLAMQEQSHKLKELVAVFQVEAAARAPAASASARPALPAKKPAPPPAAKPAAARAARKTPPARPAKPAAVAEDWEEF